MKLIGTMASLFVPLFLVSCAQDGFDDKESWSSDVSNQTLTSPKADDIVVSKNADGSNWVITWPLVKGAGGFLCNVKNVTDPENVVSVVTDSLVDGCSLTFPRAEDSNYELYIKTVGNTKLNNTDAAETTQKSFTSFSPTWKEIPAGSDITTWLAANPIPDEMTDEVCIDLVAGAEYTMSGNFDYGTHLGAIRCTVASRPATIKLTGNASFVVDNGFTMKNLIIDASESVKPVIAYNETPLASQKGTGDYYIITEPLYLSNVKVTGVQDRLIYDNKVKYAVKTCIIDNCQLNSIAIDATPFIHLPGGFINDLTIRNSTIWDSATGKNNYFVQYSNSGRCDRAGFSTNSIIYTNCTFYNIAKTGQMGNYSGFAGRTTSIFTLKNNIFVDCGNNQVPRRVCSGSNDNAQKTFQNNTYWYNGADEDPGTWDTSGSQVLGDPGFSNPAAGDFHYSGSAQKALSLGDPRWL